MALPVGTVVEITMVGQIFNQTTMNVFHYVVGSSSTTVRYDTEMVDLLAQHWNNGVGTISEAIINSAPTAWTNTRMTAQAIHPERLVRITQLRGHEGVRDVANTANLQASITFQTERAGRTEVGGKRFVMCDSDSLEGNLTNAFKAFMTGIALECVADLNVAIGAGVYQPVIYHRAGPPALKYSHIINAFVQDTTRVMRRRTVGLGI